MKKDSKGFSVIEEWMKRSGKRPFKYQAETWEHMRHHRSGLVNAPTGYGKTFSVFLGALIQYINEYPDSYQAPRKNGLRLLWITPLRALGKDIARAMQEALQELGIPWSVGLRNGDTAVKEREKQRRQMPEVLVITPESLHLLLAAKNHEALFENLHVITVDEWHELLGSKRGVQVELAISRIVGLKKKKHANRNEEGYLNNPSNISPAIPLTVWGLSATIGNLEEAMDVLLSPVTSLPCEAVLVKAGLKKKTSVVSIFPDEIEKYPWAGHLGLKLSHRVLPVFEKHRSTLMFINTRGMSETWYQHLLSVAPELAGVMALHHGSIDQPLRLWVEEALHEGKLKAVVCTASLDLGVDFRPVEAVVQVGSPKGVARFQQRAGRSGHQPGSESKIFFLPTHSLELLEAAALKQAIRENQVESRQPFILCFDVLIQYLCTLAVSDGFSPGIILSEIRSTHAYRYITDEEWQQVLGFITMGGKALGQYDDYRKVEVTDGLYRILNRRIAMRHRLSVGTIVSDAMMKVRLIGGGFIGVIEEWFISRLNPGDVFTLAGRNLEFVMIKDMSVMVRKSQSAKSIVPSWMGGRMPLSANLGQLLRRKLDDVTFKDIRKEEEPELHALLPLFNLQRELSHLPKANELLIEHIETKDGFHVFVYPFEGRLVHEAMAMLLAWRISRNTPITFSIAMNDYGFELLSDQPIPLDDSNAFKLFSEENLSADILKGVNATEMARRKFRDIAVIGGLLFQGMPGEQVKQRHLQSSASLLFNVFSEYEPGNLLLRQAYQEVMEQQMEEGRLRNMLRRIRQGKIIIRFPEKLTPFCFPIKVDSLRETLSSEKLEDRIKKMISEE